MHFHVALIGFIVNSSTMVHCRDSVGPYFRLVLWIMLKRNAHDGEILCYSKGPAASQHQT
jgi:hypothetical protein